jgi:hypothetical protein
MCCNRALKKAQYGFLPYPKPKWPQADSEGMVLYQKMLKWYAEFMRHPEFTGKFRKMANKSAKSFNMLPTFTEYLGPRQKRPQADVACGL